MSFVPDPLLRPPSRQKRPVNARLAYDGKLFKVWQWDQVLFDGTSRVFEGLSRPDTVLVVPILDDGCAMFVREMQPRTTPVLQAIGGRIEPGESPIQAAKRELAEETGYAAEGWALWDAWQPVMKIDWAVYLFVAHRLRQVSGQSLDPGEDIQLFRIPATALLDEDVELAVDDYELLHKIYFARSSAPERRRVAELLHI